MKESKITQTIRWAITKGGYSVDRAGVPSGPNGPIVGHIKTKGERRTSYRHISITNHEGGFRTPVPVHRMIAFLKFGEASMPKDIVTRHLNSDPLDNRWDNIGIGTQSDNMGDRDPEDRSSHAKVAARARRRFDDGQVEEILRRKADGWTYKRLSDEYKASKGMLCDIVKGKQYPEFEALRKELGL